MPSTQPCVEDEPRMRDGAQRADLDARLEEQPAAHRLRRGDAQRAAGVLAAVCVVPCPKTSSRPSTAITAKIVITTRRVHSPTISPRGSGTAATSVNSFVTGIRFGGARKLPSW